MVLKTRFVIGFVFAAALLLAGRPAVADFDYAITVDTTAYSGKGSLDLQFNPTGGTGVLTGTVGSLGGIYDSIGSVTYSLGNASGTTAPFTFIADNTNGPSVNEITADVTLGNTLGLTLHIATSDALSTASFFLTLYDQSNNLISAVPGGAGFAVEIDLAPNPSGSQPLPVAPQYGPGAYATPEPPSPLLLAEGMGCLVIIGLLGRRFLVVAA